MYNIVITTTQLHLTVSNVIHYVMIETILRHHFKLGLKATETAHRIQEVGRNKTISDCTV